MGYVCIPICFARPNSIHTRDDLAAKTKLEIANLKDRGWYSAGVYEPVKRGNDSLTARTMVTLDADNCDPWETVETTAEALSAALGGCSVLAHTTFSHTSDVPKFRIVVPLQQDVKPGSFEPLSRFVADKIGIEHFDPSTHQGARVMYWPCDVGGQYQHHVAGEGMLDVKEFLGRIPDWRKYRTWPRADIEGPARRTQTKAEDPTQKSGVIGAFCRAFSIPEVIENHELPYEQVGERWRYTEGEGPAGAIWYEADHGFYSHHSSDPAQGYSNAWDLVRVHKHAHLDTDDSVPISERPSQQAMEMEALELPEVRAELAGKPSPTPTEETAFEKVKEQIENAKPVSVADISQFVSVIAATRVSETERDALLRTLKEACESKPGLTSLKADLKKAQKRQAGADKADIDRVLIETLLHERYEDGRHLRRHAKQFWRYLGGVWKQVSDEIVRGSLQDQVSLMRSQATEELDGELVQLLEEKSTATIMTARWAMMVAHVAHMHDGDDLLGLMNMNVEPVMNFRNGELRFSDDGKPRLHAHNPDHLLTEQLAIDYNPKADTAIWDGFMDLLFGDKEEPEEMRRHFEEFCGYVLQPWRGLAVFGLIKSPPNSGKTTFGNVMTGLLSTSMVGREMARYDKSDSHDTAGLVGKLLLLDDDYPVGAMLPDGFLKKVSEAKLITANPKNAAQYSFVCRAIPLIFSNHWPGMRDHSGGVRRRAMVWELDPIPPFLQHVKDAKAVWTDGLQGAALRFVEGFGRLWKRQEWDTPKESKASLGRWMSDCNTVLMWKERMMREAQHSFVHRSETYRDYKEWYADAYATGGRHYKKKQFFEVLEGILGPVQVSNGNYGWHGWEIVKDKEREGDFDYD